jgi:hypothetical protein
MPDMSARVQSCRAHADQCRARAALTDDEHVQDDFLRLAEQWSKLAREIEEIEQMRTFVGNAEKP